MKFKIGDRVKMRNERHARSHGVWGEIGIVTEIVDDGTSVDRITVEFPNEKPIVGMETGQFEKA